MKNSLVFLSLYVLRLGWGVALAWLGRRNSSEGQIGNEFSESYNDFCEQQLDSH
jgi:hypothetical protein